MSFLFYHDGQKNSELFAFNKALMEMERGLSKAEKEMIVVLSAEMIVNIV